MELTSQGGRPGQGSSCFSCSGCVASQLILLVRYIYTHTLSSQAENMTSLKHICMFMYCLAAIALRVHFVCQSLDLNGVTGQPWEREPKTIAARPSICIVCSFCLAIFWQNGITGQLSAQEASLSMNHNADAMQCNHCKNKSACASETKESCACGESNHMQTYTV